MAELQVYFKKLKTVSSLKYSADYGYFFKLIKNQSIEKTKQNKTRLYLS